MSWQAAPPPRIEESIRLEPDGSVTAFSGKVDFGQGIRTAFGQIVADELDVPLDRVRVVLGNTAEVPYDFGTFGSQSIVSDGTKLRRAAAAARAQLIARASKRLGVAAGKLETGDASVRAAGGRAVGYADLLADGPLTGLVPEDVAVKPREALRIVGHSQPRREARAIVTGEPLYVTDVRLPGMLRGAVVRLPTAGAKLRSVDDARARTMPGVVAVVRDGDFLGVVAEGHEQAQAALVSLAAEWSETDRGAGEPLDISLRRDAGIDAALSGAGRRIEVTYALPHIANAPIGPSGAVADVRADGATVYTGSQRPFGVRAEVANLLGIPPAQVDVKAMRSSGTFGRNNSDDAPLEAVRLSRAAKRPVLVQWTREDEFRVGTNRPAAYVEAEGALADDGRIAAWRYRVTTNAHILGQVPPQVTAVTSGSGALPVYDIPAVEVHLRVEAAPLRTASFRSLAGAENVFAIESLVDELAALAGSDPMDFRLRHITDARLAAVVRLVAERSGWDARPRGGGRGLGMACTSFEDTRIAQVADVSVDERGAVRVHRLWSAIDPGLVINPDGLRNQIEGAMLQGTSFTLFEEVRHRGGRIASTGWDTYPIATFEQAPAMEVIVAGDAEADPSGAGEAGIVPISAAIANAVFAASGVRCRELPLTRENVRRARQASSEGVSR